MTDVLSQPLKRPKRAAAANALYRSCPSCDRKFLITEIEFHVNMCLQKMEREAAKLSPKETKTKPEQTDRFPADKKVIVIYLYFPCVRYLQYVVRIYSTSTSFPTNSRTI